MSNQEIGILFYTNNKKNNDYEITETFIKLLKNNNLLKQFKCVSIDDNRNIPNYINQSPTIVIKQSQQILSGKTVFKWFEQIKQMQSSKPIVYNTNNEEHNIIGYAVDEMNSKSDKFALIDIDEALRQSYGNCKQEHNIFFVPEKYIEKEKINMEKQKDIINDIYKKRYEQDEKYKKFYIKR